MSREAHTAGPWTVGEGDYADTVFGPDGFEIASTPQASAIHRDYFAERMGDDHWATTPGAHRDVRDGEGEANARLIAGAPALLKAAKDADDVLAAHGFDPDNSPRAELRAAIQSATGEG